MARKILKLKITGVSPLLMHNGQLADPLNKFTKAIKEISGKRKKTDADHEELARLEWHGSLYLRDGKPCMPGALVEACLCEAAKKTKMGKQAKAGIICPEDSILIHDGSGELEQLFKDGYRLTTQCNVQRNKIMRTRPMFRTWSTETTIWFEDSMFNRDQLISIAKTAGDFCGLGDWRPKFGRFSVEEI